MNPQSLYSGSVTLPLRHTRPPPLPVFKSDPEGFGKPIRVSAPFSRWMKKNSFRAFSRTGAVQKSKNPNEIDPREGRSIDATHLQRLRRIFCVSDTLLRDKLECLRGANIFESRGQCYKTFFVRNLWIFVISWSVCPWQAFPA